MCLGELSPEVRREERRGLKSISPSGWKEMYEIR